MKNYILLALSFILGLQSFGQSKILYEEFYSEKLGEARKIKIQLPRNYEANEDKVYPIVLVLDGDICSNPLRVM